MEEAIINKAVRNNNKKNTVSTIRFDKETMKQIQRLTDKANKKQFGKKIYPKDILSNVLKLVDDVLLNKVIKKSQEESLTQRDKKKIFFKEHMNKFNGSVEQFEAKMLELMDNFLSQNPV